MKKKIFGLGLLTVTVISLVLGGVWFAASNGASSKAILVLDQGVVEYKTPADENYSLLSTNEQEVPSGTFVKTSLGSYALIYLPDNSLITLDESTEVQVNYESGQVSIDQLIGNSWHRVQTLLNGGKYQVTTPNAVAAVRGTIFNVQIRDETHTQISVEESNVDVSRYENKEGGVELLETQNLVASDWALVTKEKADYKITKGLVPQNIKESKWYLRNKIIDQEYEGLKNSRGGKALREALKQRLQDSKEFSPFKISRGNQLTDKDRNNILDLNSLLNISDQTCQAYSLGQIQESLEAIRTYQRYISASNDLEVIVTELYKSCEDGKFSLQEAKQLEDLITTFNKTN